MARLERLTADQVEAFHQRGRRVDTTPYRAALRDLVVGEGLAITIETGESPSSIKRRVSMAARQEGVCIRWLRKQARGPVRLERVE